MVGIKEVLDLKDKILSQSKKLKKELTTIKKEFKAEKGNPEFTSVCIYLNSRIERLDKVVNYLNLALQDKTNTGKYTEYFKQMLKESNKELKTYAEITNNDMMKELLERYLSNVKEIKI